MSRVEWINEEDAAKVLELSEKRVRQFAAAGAVKTKRETNQETKRPHTMYHAGDVERLKEQRRLNPQLSDLLNPDQMATAQRGNREQLADLFSYHDPAKREQVKRTC